MDLGLFSEKKHGIVKQNEALKEQIAKKLEKQEETLVIDRIEEQYAICENRATGDTFSIKKEYLPSNIKEGDVIQKLDGVYKKDETKQKEIEKRIKDKMNQLWN